MQVLIRSLSIGRGRVKGFEYFRPLVPALLAILAFSGCATNRYETPVANFQAQTQQSISVLSDFYSSRNSYEIDIYLQGVAADPTKTVATNDTPLGAPVFSPASIQARLDALTLVGVFATRLSDLANTQAPATFQTAATALGKNLSSLNTTFQSLAPSDSFKTANNYVGPITSLIGAIGQMYLERKRDEMITNAISQGAQPVNTILSQLRDDMQLFTAQIATGAPEKLAELIQVYNNEDRSKLSFDERSAQLAQIKAAAAEASASVGSAPSGLVTLMINAFNELVQAASKSTKGKPASLAALNASLQAWANELSSLSSQIKLLVH